MSNFEKTAPPRGAHGVAALHDAGGTSSAGQARRCTGNCRRANSFRLLADDVPRPRTSSTRPRPSGDGGEYRARSWQRLHPSRSSMVMR